MHQALYREYRPETFREVLGQNTIIKILKSQVDMDSVSHAYLFCGTRGTGKTTTARLLAKAVNCLSEDKPCGICENCLSIKNGTFIDLIEIDAASNNGVGDIRQLRESVIFPPAVGRKKVYIIDEVHMLSREAFNAFLKTLEEPPENVIFILATTEPHKLPQTILSRCLRMDFKRVSEESLVERMSDICRKREIEISQDTLRLIATNADGSVRDGLTLLDQCISGRTGKITRNDVLESIGAVGEEWYIEFAKWLMRGSIREVLALIDSAMAEGKDPRQILSGILNHYRNLLLAKYVKHPEDALNMSIENAEKIKEQSYRIELEQIDGIILELAEVSKNMMTTTQPRILLEVACIKISAKYGTGHNKMPAMRNVQSDFISESDREIKEIKTKENLQFTEKKDIEYEPEHIEKSKIKNNDETLSISENSEQNVKGHGELEEKKLPNMDYIWEETVKIAQKENPRMILLKFAYPKNLKDGEIHIVYENNSVKSFLEQDRELLQKILLDITGENLRIKLFDEKKERGVDIEETAQKAQELLGIDVRITD